MASRLVFGGVLASVLLGLYIYSIVQAIEVSEMCAAAADAVANQVPDAKLCPPVKTNLGNVSYILNLIGGLISATVVGILATTKPNELPAADLVERNLNASLTRSIASFVPFAYIMVWIFCGVALVIFGLLKYESEPVPPLTAQAKAWLGTAVAAIYAYFGIDQSSGRR